MIRATQIEKRGGGAIGSVSPSVPPDGGNMNNLIKATAVLAVLVTVLSCFVIAAEDSDADGTVVYVSADGDDTNGDGSLASPYATLKKAVETIATEGTVEILTDFNMQNSDKVTISEEKTITLDMNHRTAKASSDFSGRYITNNGTLKVIGNGTFDDNDAAGYFGPIDNYGTLVVDNGTFSGNTESNASIIWNRLSL